MGIARFDLDTHDLELAMRALKRTAAGWLDVLRDEAQTMSHTVVWVMRNELEAVRYTGQMERSVNANIVAQRGGVEVTVGPTVPYATYIRYGTRPHWAPIAPLKRWAMWKLGDERAGYAVQRSIAKFGTSRWAEQLYGTKENPYDERTMNRPETRLAIERFEDACTRRMILMIVRD